MNNIREVLALGFFLCVVVWTGALASKPFYAKAKSYMPHDELSAMAAPTNYTPTEDICANAVNNATSDDTNCNACVKAANGQCFYCFTDHKCRAFFTQNIFHTPDECDFTEARIWTCEINLQILAIALMSIVGVVLVLILVCCCYCCCCRRSHGKTRFEREMEKQKADRQRRKDEAENRRRDREARYEEIRRKYNLHETKPGAGYKKMG